MKKVVLIILVLLICLIILISVQSDEMVVSRSLVMPAAAEEIFPQVNDFRNWNNWSPWAKLDPNAVHEFEGPSSGEGAIFKWNGNKDVGQGTNTIIKSKPNELVELRLEFLKPFKATSQATFEFEPEGQQTRVTWTMRGTKNFIMKGMSLVMDCEKMQGDQFLEGLMNLRNVVQKP